MSVEQHRLEIATKIRELKDAISQREVVTANAQFDDMSKAIKSFEDAEIVVMRSIEAAEISARQKEDQLHSKLEEHEDQLRSNFHKHKRRSTQLEQSQKKSKNNTHQPTPLSTYRSDEQNQRVRIEESRD